MSETDDTIAAPSFPAFLAAYVLWATAALSWAAIGIALDDTGKKSALVLLLTLVRSSPPTTWA